MGHKLPIWLKYLEGGVEDGNHELPQFAAGRLRDRNICEVTEHVVHLLAFVYELVYR